LSNSDYIYSIIVEETGLIGGVFVIGLYFWLLYSVILIAKDCKRVFSAMLVCGLGILIVTQAMIHILVNVGVLPVTGQTLPLISSGGSSVLAVSIAFGMMLSVSRALKDERLYTLELTEEEMKSVTGDEKTEQS
jgi:cell division protein FtsW